MMRVKSVSPTDEPMETDVRSGLGRSEPAAWPSAADRCLLWLLRLTGQTGGSSWPARLYAATLYTMLVVANGYIVVRMAGIGGASLARGEKFLDVAFKTFFFGTMQALSLAPLTSTVLCGRRRYAVLFSEVQTLLEEMSRSTDIKVNYKSLTRKVYILLVAKITLAAVIPLLLFALLKTALYAVCAISPLACVKLIAFYISMIASQVSFFMVPIKFLYITLLLGGGFRAVDAELQSLARDGDLKDWARLARLRGLQDRLSTAFSRLVTDMTPELIPSLSFGIAGLVISFLVVFQSAKAGTLLSQLPLLSNMLLAVVLLIVVPCEAGQHMLDLVAAIRGSLLRLHWEAPRVGQEVSMLQEAVRRDLEHLGDLGYYRLQRSTIISIMSTIITYIIVFVQFSTS